MKTFEVIIDKPSKIQDWCIYDNRTIWVDCKTTTAIITAFSDVRLKAKIEKLYSGYKILSIKEVNL